MGVGPRKLNFLASRRIDSFVGRTVVLVGQPRGRVCCVKRIGARPRASMPRMLATAEMVEGTLRGAGVNAPLVVMRGDGGVMSMTARNVTTVRKLADKLRA